MSFMEGVWNYILCNVLCIGISVYVCKNTQCMFEAKFSVLKFMFLEIEGYLKPCSVYLSLQLTQLFYW